MSSSLNSCSEAIIREREREMERERGRERATGEVNCVENKCNNERNSRNLMGHRAFLMVVEELEELSTLLLAMQFAFDPHQFETDSLPS